MFKQWQQWWGMRSLREQLVLKVWLVVCSTMVLIFGCVLPVHQRIAQLEKRIPSLESQLNKMRSSAVTLKGAVEAKSDSGKKATGDLRSRLFAWLAQKKIKAEIRPVSSERVEMSFAPMSLLQSTQVLRSMRTDTFVRVQSLQIRKEESSNKVSVVANIEARL